MRMSGSSWNDGTITEVVASKSFTTGRARCERMNRYSHRPQTMAPAMATGKYGVASV